MGSAGAAGYYRAVRPLPSAGRGGTRHAAPTSEDSPIAGQPEAALELREIARRFGRRWALRGVSMRVEPGEVLALVGHNGSGKTTLLRIAATALAPTRGEGAVFGVDIAREAAAVRHLVGLLAHRPGLYDDLTALENLRFAAAMLALPADARSLHGLLARVGLEREMGERVRHFSAGMQRRLAIARLLLRPPRLLLLDEPYASLDDDGVALVNALVHDTRARGGAAVLATHELERARPVVDVVSRLDAGRLAPARAGVGARLGDGALLGARGD